MTDSEQYTFDNLIKPVWVNTFWVRNALEQDEAIGKMAMKLNGAHSHFWGTTQKFALDSAVMGICKIYDTRSQRNKKCTVYEILKFLERSISEEHFRYLDQEKLKTMGFEDDALNRITSGSLGFEERKSLLLCSLRGLLPTPNLKIQLDRLFTYRDKALAHQDRIDDALKEQFKSLPSLADMGALNDAAGKLCELVSPLFFNTGLFRNSGPSNWMSTLNVIKKFLNISFDDPNKTASENYKEQEDFYRRLP
jgi:hypothetical protein